MAPAEAHIYGLYDPRIPDVIWYVGKTNNAHNRLQYYRKDSSTTPVYRWFRRLQSEGAEPKLRILETCPFSEWKDRERAMIALHRKKNLLLLNVFDGGNGTAIKGRKEFCDHCGTKRVQLYPSDSTLRCPVCRPKQRRAYEVAWNQQRPGYQEKYRKQYYHDNQEKLMADSSAYYWKNREKYLSKTNPVQSQAAQKREAKEFLRTVAWG